VSEPRIASPMPLGSGAYVVHEQLARHIPGYQVLGYDARWTYVPFMLRRYRRAGARLVHTTPDHAIFVAPRGAPLVVTFHGYVLDRYMRQFSSLSQRLHYATDLRWWTKMALRRADAVTAVSRFTADRVREDLGYRGEIKVIPNGVDTAMFSPAPRRDAGGAGVKVLFSGNLRRHKGADLLRAIADRLAPGTSVLYTRGLRSGAELPAHPRLECVGSIPHARMPEVYGRADVLLLPTVREGFSMTVLEAMACGLPVVASDCASLPEQVEHGKGGFLCPIGDVGALAAALNRLAGSPDLCRQMGEFNRRKAENEFPLGAMVKGYEAIFKEVADA